MVIFGLAAVVFGRFYVAIAVGTSPGNEVRPEVVDALQRLGRDVRVRLPTRHERQYPRLAQRMAYVHATEINEFRDTTQRNHIKVSIDPQPVTMPNPSSSS